MNNRNTKNSLTTGFIQSRGRCLKAKPSATTQESASRLPPLFELNCTFYYWIEFILADVPAEDIFNDHFLHDKVFPHKPLCRSRTFSLKVWLLLAEWTDLNHCQEIICSFVSLVMSNFCLKLWLKYVHLSWFTKCGERAAYPKSCLSNHYNP